MTKSKLGTTLPLVEFKNVLPSRQSPKSLPIELSKEQKKEYETSVSFLYKGEIVPGIWGEKLSYPLTKGQEERLRDAGFKLFDINRNGSKVEYIFEQV